VTKALRLVRELIPVPPLRIVLEKNIPAEAGLGGGSSDAGGLLRALRHFVSPGPEVSFLKDVAGAVGKDVPFFLMGGRARGEGYGELITPLPDPEPVWYVIVLPKGVSGSTKVAYAKLDELLFPFSEFPEEGVLYNDFERVASCESLEYLDMLLAYGASGALLTGSGAAVFGVFEERSAAQQAIYRLSQDSRVRTWLAPSLSREESLRIDVEN
jgi:4-diphosphocytidyl-2-C-methyl-D-erythritol kinase